MNETMSYHRYRGNRWRGINWKLVLLAAALLAVLCFVIPFGAVVAGAHTDIQGDPQVMIIFGCQVKPWGPSILLQDRLDTALDYLEDHPDMTVVVSGGKGDDEHVSEAQCMYDYLTEHGVDGERILMEDRSVNTRENIYYSFELLAANGYDTTADMVAVSNGFHLARIRMLWDRAGGAYNLSTLAAPSSHLPSRIWMYVREPLALVKSFLFDWGEPA